MRTPLRLVLLACLGVVGESAFAADRPNLILVTGDDMGFQLGCYGDTVATTPHMDRLAREGTRFTRGYVTQASCSSSRSSMLTGLYPHQNGQIGLAHLGYSMRAGVPTLPTLLKQAGYRTGIIGKLHVAPESSFDFDYKQTNTADTRDPKKVRAKCGEFLGDLGGKPFFLMLNFFDPHDPHLQDVEGSPQAKVTPEQAKVFPFIGADTPELRRRVAEFTTCVNRVDEGVGVLMDVLHERRPGHEHADRRARRQRPAAAAGQGDVVRGRCQRALHRLVARPSQAAGQRRAGLLDRPDAHVPRIGRRLRRPTDCRAARCCRCCAASRRLMARVAGHRIHHARAAES